MQTDMPQINSHVRILKWLILPSQVRSKLGQSKILLVLLSGTDVANVGFALMAQSAVIDIAGATSANQVVATISC
jgi:hypothetical protein